MGHSLLSPSAAKRWFNCAGSINLIRTLPKEAFKTSKYAVEGTVAHGLAEDYLTGKLDLMALLAKSGTTVMEEGFEIAIDDAMVDGVLEYADHAAGVKKRLTKPGGVVDKTEVRVFVKEFENLPEPLYGTADKLIYQKGNELHVIDFKYGKGVVEAEENEQGLIYVVGAQDRWDHEESKSDGAAGVVFDRVFFHIVQPRAYHGEGTVRTWEISKLRVEEFRKDLSAAVRRTQDPKAPRVAGSWCKFCPANGWAEDGRGFVCPESRAEVERAVDATFTTLPAPPSKEVGMTFLPDPGAMAGDQLARALGMEETVEHWFKRANECALERLLKDPNAIPDWKVVEGRANRQWSSEEAAEAAFAALGDNRYKPRALKSPAQMEKIAGKEEVAKHAVKPLGRPSLAPASDKRPALNPAAQAADVFSVLPGGAGDVFGDMAGPAPKKEAIWP